MKRGIVTNMKKIDRYYVSEIDKKMAEFNQLHPNSASQQFEHEKYQAIYKRRDNAIKASPDQNDIWD